MEDEREPFNKIVNLPFMKGKKSNLDDALGLLPLAQNREVVPLREDGDDYQTAREIAHYALSVLKTSAEQLTDLAYQAQHPRSYEVLADIASKMKEGAEGLVDMKNKHDSAIEGPKTINNTLMISSAEMLDRMKDKLKEKDDGEL